MTDHSYLQSVIRIDHTALYLKIGAMETTSTTKDEFREQHLVTGEPSASLMTNEQLGTQLPYVRYCEAVDFPNSRCILRNR